MPRRMFATRHYGMGETPCPPVTIDDIVQTAELAHFGTSDLVQHFTCTNREQAAAAEYFEKGLNRIVPPLSAAVQRVSRSIHSPRGPGAMTTSPSTQPTHQEYSPHLQERAPTTEGLISLCQCDYALARQHHALVAGKSPWNVESLLGRRAWALGFRKSILGARRSALGIFYRF